jgi:anti-sigma B factor antagonist
MNTFEGWSGGNVLEIEVDRSDGAYVITVTGEVDLSTADNLETELTRANASDAAKVIVDLSGVSFIDSRGLRVLLMAEMASRTDSRRLHFLHGSPQVERVLDISGVGRELRFLD